MEAIGRSVRAAEVQTAYHDPDNRTNGKSF